MSTVNSTSNVTMGNISDLMNATSQTKSTSTTNSSLANKEVFLQLLVAQLKNQDPESPADGTAFVTQLAQFTQLEQTIGSRQDVASILKVLNNMQTGADAAATQSGDSDTTNKTSSSSTSGTTQN